MRLKSLLALIFVGVAGALPYAARADWTVCIDPANTAPFSTDFGEYEISNDLLSATVGLSGTFTFGGGSDGTGTTQLSPCFNPNTSPKGPLTVNAAGGFGLMVVNGSIQDSNYGPIDDDMALTFGAPLAGGNFSHFEVVGDNGARVIAGAGGFDLKYVGQSDRYMHLEEEIANFHETLQIDVIGDAARVQWYWQNNTTAAHDIGLWWGAWTGMNRADGATSGYAFAGWGPQGALMTSQKTNFVVMPGQKPQLLMRRIRRAKEPSVFPAVAQMLFSQSFPIGLKIRNGPLATSGYDLSVTVAPGAQADTQADEIVFGDASLDAPSLLGGTAAQGLFPDYIFPINSTDTDHSDVGFEDDNGFIQKYYPKTIAPGGSRAIVQYIGTNWGVSDYHRPYTTVVDAPPLLDFSIGGINHITPNPFTIRVWVDNTRGFSSFDKDIPIYNVLITMDLPKATGFTYVTQSDQNPISVTKLSPDGVLTDYWEVTKTIPVIQPRAMGSMDFVVQSDGLQSGALPYVVTVSPTPGDVTTLTGSITSSITPQLSLVTGPNLVTLPWQSPDTSLSYELDLPVTAFQAYAYDPASSGYIAKNTAERGRAFWLVVDQDYQNHALNPNLTAPADGVPGGAYSGVVGGYPAINMKGGWNQIGNPYQLPVKLGELVGVSAANPKNSYLWPDLVSQGIVSGGLAEWDAVNGQYQFIGGNDTYLMPGVGYWLYVTTEQDLTLKYPEVFFPGLQNSPRAVSQSRSITNWTQQQDAWRLQLVGRSNKSVDSITYVGVVPTSAEAALLSIPKPPMSPNQDLEVAVPKTQTNGRVLNMAQSIETGNVKHTWAVNVKTSSAGTFTVTWPNARSVPANVKLRLVDVATGQTRDMRQVSGYSFTTNAAGTREFQIQADTGAVSKALIGNVVVSRPSRDPSAAFTIVYTLTGDATTSVRVLSGAGAEVFGITRGRADKMGQNSVSWNLHDNANRAVAPGTYRVEIVAQTSDGDRVRRIIPINVVR